MALTGIYSPMAFGQMQAYQLWESDVNSKGGIYVKEYGKRLPVKLVYYDDKSDASTAIRIYEKLITSDKVDLLLSPQSTTIHFAIAPLAAKYKMPIVGTTAASVKLREIKNDYFWFITSCMPDRQMEALVGLLKHQNIKSIAILYLQDLFPYENYQFLAPLVKKEGFEVLVSKDYAPGTKDFTTILSDIKRKNPDAVLALCYPAGAFTITAQAQEVDLNPKLFFQLIGPSLEPFEQKFGPVGEGLTTMGHWSPSGNWPGAKEFNARFRDKFKNKPDYLDSVLSYTGCQVVEQAIEAVGSLDREKLRDYIANHEFQTINGPLKFTGSENMRMPSMILQFKNRDMEIVWPPETATSEIIYPKPPWPRGK
jgi:branched-chain amino acid transport system substrate-binding protein